MKTVGPGKGKGREGKGGEGKSSGVTFDLSLIHLADTGTSDRLPTIRKVVEVVNRPTEFRLDNIEGYV